MNQIKELFSFSPFSAGLVHLVAAQLLNPSEGAARGGQLGQEKGQNFTFWHLRTC